MERPTNKEKRVKLPKRAPTPFAQAMADGLRDKDLSVYQLAKSLDEPPSMLLRYLRGESDPRLGPAKRIAGHLGFSLDDLVSE